LSGTGADQQFHLEPDDRELLGDGIDATRVVMRVTDEFVGARPFATGAIALNISGPGEIIGDNPFSLFGGVGAVWIKTRQAAGMIRLTATHPTLGSKSIEIRVTRAPAILI
jgi:beta-galactosidase